MNDTLAKFKELKKEQTINLRCSLAVVKRTRSKNPEQMFSIKYIDVSEDLEKKLKNIVVRKILLAKSCEKYSYDCSEPDEDSVKTIENDRTDFMYIYDNLVKANPEVDKIRSAVDLMEFKPEAYLIVLRDNVNIKIVGFRTIPPNWKIARRKGLESILFKEHRFENLEEQDIFSIYNSVDFIHYEGILFALSVKNFESALKFKEGMYAKVHELNKDVEELGLFRNFDLLQKAAEEKVSLLRKLATIKNLEHYKNPEFIKNLKEVVLKKGWNINFDGDKILITEDSLEDILSVLQDKRLHSEISLQDFDVTSKKNIG